MRILITGGAGFIGSNLLTKIDHERHQTFVIDNFASGESGYDHSKTQN